MMQIESTVAVRISKKTYAILLRLVKKTKRSKRVIMDDAVEAYWNRWRKRR